MKYLTALSCTMLLFVALGMAWCQGDAGNQAQITFDNTGLTSLSYNGVNLLQDGALQINFAQMSKWDGTTFAAADLSHERRSVDITTRTVTCAYAWGKVTCQYLPGTSRLDMVMTVTNTGGEPLHAIVLQPLTLHFPAAVTLVKDQYGVDRKGNNVEAPTVISLNYGKGTVMVTNEEMARPLYVGLASGIDEKTVGAPYPIRVSTTQNHFLPTKWMEDQAIDRTIYPETTDTFHIALRFGGGDATMEQLAGDIYQQFAEAYPFADTWPDHRPIGMLSLCSVEMTTAKNPRGYLTTEFMNPDCKFDFKGLDIATKEGLEALHTNLMTYADMSMAEMKRVGAQGMITWDIEGQQYPHATSYLADPRSLPAEMDPIADEYFKKFTDAGFRVGIAIRPQRPVRYVYKDGVEQIDVNDILYNLEQKIGYANKRWGCTIFYIDSNAKHDPFGSWSDEAAYQLMPSTIFEQLAQKFPNCLLIPEQKDTRYQAYTSPYRELRQGFPETPAKVRRVYPKAFSVICVNDGDFDKYYNDVLDGVKKGDILLFRSWFKDAKFNDKVISIYQDAAKAQQK